MSSIAVDDRAGSAQMAPMLRRLGCAVELTRLEYGDVSFVGLAQDGSPVSTGLELKSVEDALACIVSGRFAGHQLPGMIQSYDHLWLMLQGQWRPHPQTGVLQYLKTEHRRGQKHEYWTEAVGQRRWHWRELEGWILSVSILGGMRVHRVDTWEEGASYIKLLYNWYQRDVHKSIQVVYSGKQLYSDQALLIRPSLARRLSKELPHIGVEKSKVVAERFPTAEAMVNATEREWAELPGIGKKLASDIWRSLRGA